MANTLLTIDMITNETLMVLENSLTFARQIRRNYDNRFAQSGAKIGDTLNIRKPSRFLVRDGRVVQLQAITEQSVPLTLNHQLGVDVTYTSVELALSIDQFRDRVIKPQIAAVANQADVLAFQMYKDVFNYVGTPGAIPNALSTYLEAGAFLDEEAAPRDEQRKNVIGPRMQVAIVDALKGLFQSSQQISRQYEKGLMGIAAGFDWYMDQNTPSHTIGPLGGVPVVNSAGQTGSNLITDGWTGAVATRLFKGDIITIADVYAVNPQSRLSTAQLRRFVVTADTQSDVGGNMTIPIYPPLITSGAYQTVTASPADGAVILVFGHANAHANKVSPQGMAFHPDAFVMASADLPLPGGTVEAARVSDDQLGISIRMISDYDIVNDAYITRLDWLCGFSTVYPELAVRVVS